MIDWLRGLGAWGRKNADANDASTFRQFWSIRYVIICGRLIDALINGFALLSLNITAAR